MQNTSGGAERIVPRIFLSLMMGTVTGERNVLFDGKQIFVKFH